MTEEDSGCRARSKMNLAAVAVALRSEVLARRDHAAEAPLFLYGTAVRLHVRHCRDGVRELGQIRRATDLLQHSPVTQPTGNRNDVYGAAIAL
jgi:hypothetical protein